MILPITYNFNVKSKPTMNLSKKTSEPAAAGNPGFERYNSYWKKMAQMSPSFTAYSGDPEPAKRLFYLVTGRSDIYEDDWTKYNLYNVSYKKWIVDISPNILLKRTMEQALQSICTIIKPDIGLPQIPSNIQTPDFGDKWGRNANYIEINPRIVAKYNDDSVTEGLFGVIKLLPAIPPSPSGFANCLVLSQLYPSHHDDGTINEGSIYGNDIGKGISKTILSPELDGKMSDKEQVKAFNDLAHIMGFKTGFRMSLGAGQLWINGEQFNWKNNRHEKAFIDACVDAVDMGFDSIYFDSAKHIIDKDGCQAVGELPDKEQMAYILYEIRDITKRGNLSFIGEMCGKNPVYKEMGFTAGTGWGNSRDITNIREESRSQAWNTEYAAGPDLSNDNDDYPNNLHKMNMMQIKMLSCLFGYDRVKDKLPAFMQLNDLFPLSPFTTTHELMLKPKKMSQGNAAECVRHWDGVFDLSEEAKKYNDFVIIYMFAKAMYQK